MIAALALSSCGLFRKTAKETRRASSEEQIVTSASKSEVTASTAAGTSDRLRWADVTEGHVTEFVAEGNVTVARDGTVSADQVRGRTAGNRKDNTREASRDSLSAQMQTTVQADSGRTESRSAESSALKKTSSPDWKLYGWITGVFVLVILAWWFFRKFR